jgi:AraC family transcriptional regulator, alkane utilization regulator
MSRTTRSTPATAAVRWQAGDDVLTSLLRSLRLQSSVFCRAELKAPWGLALDPQEYAHFHVVEEGSGWLRSSGEKQAQPLRQGDLVVIPHGGGHVLTDAPATRPVPLGSLIKPASPGGPHVVLRFGGGGAVTRLVCGAFQFGPSGRPPLLAVLPPAIVVRGHDGRPPAWLDRILGSLGDEARRDQPGSETVISRLTDVIFVQALRAWMQSQPDTKGGWLGALHDPQIGRSLALIHRHPERAWTVATLGAGVGMSRSPFSARFKALVGEGPLSYVRRWRMQLAGDLLVREPLTVAEVAERVGYQSEAALSRAFRREWGITPSAHRRRTVAA